ncbi:hypothetical protein BLNAU_1445 [Blattamonas nauphoetae]|uniref:Uncharacterized protein n=1 Tax=Blattamonas nauphoetae TaxID=2049346 RepID=A0ABQ9YI19_9EUKA|nr:hypothetical protein BLNAU_1440 [Blattamonas nauphoetae]KAK2963404.1 hypothetical protein BLNAU_1445 [Blattamonas nauphoetae]
MGGDGGHSAPDSLTSVDLHTKSSLAFLLDALNFTFDEDSSDKHTFLLITLHYPTSSPLDAEIVFLCLFNISAIFQTPSCHFLVVSVVSVTSVRL